MNPCADLHLFSKQSGRTKMAKDPPQAHVRDANLVGPDHLSGRRHSRAKSSPSPQPRLHSSKQPPRSSSTPPHPSTSWTRSTNYPKASSALPNGLPTSRYPAPTSTASCTFPLPSRTVISTRKPPPGPPSTSRSEKHYTRFIHHHHPHPSPQQQPTKSSNPEAQQRNTSPGQAISPGPTPTPSTSRNGFSFKPSTRTMIKAQTIPMMPSPTNSS